MPLITTSQATTRIFLPGTIIPVPRQPSHPSSPPHDSNSTFAVAYVNEIGRDTMASKAAAKFPTGSIIVREKLVSRDATRPELLAVMVKRARGFNPPGGDWEYLAVDGGMTKIRKQQKTGSCSGCHSTQRDRDFVFALPETK